MMYAKRSLRQRGHPDAAINRVYSKEYFRIWWKKG